MTASTHRTPWYKNSCITGALANGALHVGIDAIGRVAHTPGLRVRVFDLVVPSLYPLTGLIVTVRYKPPTRKPDAWGTLVSYHSSALQQWYPLIDGRPHVEGKM